MLHNYIITALRNLKRHKLYSIVNISGLVVGLAIFILAATFFSFHLSFDSFHKDLDRIYLVISQSNPSGSDHWLDASSRLPLGFTLPFFVIKIMKNNLTRNEHD